MAKEAAIVCPICATGMCKSLAIIAIIAGILFLLQDLGIWAFWNISWYTVGFILVGLAFLMHKHK